MKKQEEQEELKRDLEAIATDQPRTEVAALRIKRVLAKAGKEGAGMLRDVLTGIVSETASKIIWPP